MPAVFAWIETNAGPVESTATNLNFGSIDQTDLDETAYPILAGTRSFEKYVQADFSGAFTSISDLRFYLSAGSVSAAEPLLASIATSGYVQPAFASPVQSASTQAINAIPSGNPGSANVGISGSLAGSLVVPGRSDFIVAQLGISASAEAGALPSKTFTLEWLEV